MSESQRDEFSEKTRRVLGQRAAYRCSSPTCRAQTVFPHADGAKSVLTGVAAHICAAAPGGPRYDPSQSQEDRKSAANGIWLCHSCSDRVDKDPRTFPADMLREWKSGHEAWVAGQEIVPAIPAVRLVTLPGLLLPLTGDGAVDSTLADAARDHVLDITAGSRHQIENLILRGQFPESVVIAKCLKAPVGVAVNVAEERTQLVVIQASGGGRVEQHGTPHSTNIVRIEIERLGPGGPVQVALRTALGIADQGMRRAQMLIGSAGALFFFFEGSFVYSDGDQYYERHFVYPIEMPAERSYIIARAEEPGEHKLFVGWFHGQPTTLTA